MPAPANSVTCKPSHAGQLLTRQGWHKLLGDQRLMAPFTPEEGQWITEYWLTSAQRRTIVLYGAVLLPHDVFARLSVTQVLHEAHAAAMTYRLFEEDEAAQQWLASPNQLRWGAGLASGSSL